MNTEHNASGQQLLRGMRDGLPIALGYFAVAFTLGIAARNAGLGPLHGLVSSLLVNASAGQYAGYAMIAADATLWEMAAMILVVNARYFLMSCALSQKFSPETPFYHRLLVGFDVTDELFGLAIAQEGWLPPVYMYGAMMLSMPGWASGTALGIAAGRVLPARLVSALSVAVYGMFIAVITARPEGPDRGRLRGAVLPLQLAVQRPASGAGYLRGTADDPADGPAGVRGGGPVPREG